MALAKTSHTGASRDATIGAGTRIRGKISGEGNLVVEGQIEGEIAIRGNLTITEGGSVTSDIADVQTVRIAGSLEGDLSANGSVHILSGARVRGDLKGTQIAIDEGAQFTGRLDCDFQLPPELESSGRAKGAAAH
jgi:cytoskeletal protein CcmA (bactofilin family)